MAHATTHISEINATGFGAAVWRYLAAIGNALIRFGENHARSRMVAELSNKSDAELAKLGLRREDIVRHVFRDCYYI